MKRICVGKLHLHFHPWLPLFFGRSPWGEVVITVGIVTIYWQGAWLRNPGCGEA